ncbi:L,D-transpeptidase family protein [Mycobacterium sp. pV006]|uniref:L,D-transpeptidase n=1 Tax=Mycobacterium sp. pV006 TaxID=3238983 RepID=UPI00351B2D0E
MRPLQQTALICAALLTILVAAVAPAAPVSHAAVSLPRPVQVWPAPGQTVGVAHPVTVTFRSAPADREVVERSFEVRAAGAPTPAPGSVTWLDDRTVEFTPDGFYPAHSRIDVRADGLSTSFQTGAAVVSVADISAYTFTVSIDGVVARQMPASMGKAKFPTPVGRFTALSKERNVTFDSRTIGIPLDDPEGYLIKGEYGVRVTWGGVYVHSAPWSVGSQGYANVSHGCINLSPDNAAWYFDTVRIGDPIIVQA